MNDRNGEIKKVLTKTAKAARAISGAYVEARMNAAQSAKNTFTIKRDYILDADAHCTLSDGEKKQIENDRKCADEIAGAMREWFDKSGIKYVTTTDRKHSFHHTDEYIRFTWAD